uniref:Metalloprotease TIKI n=1 Tax=Accipiter nisus TaxID=211598 RepID=A0A8B9N2T9_9AVES
MSVLTQLCLPLPQQSELNSFLWTIKRDPPSYFFGTIHVPYTRVWDFIPENSKKAFQQSHIVYFELDLTDPYTISALTSCQLLPQGENLQDVLPRDIYRRLKRHLEYVKLMMPSWMTPDQRGKGLYADYLFNAIAGNWERKRPVWVMLMVNSLTEVDVKSRGVPVLDLYLAQEAERLRKQTGAVEKVEEQCHPLNGLNFSQVRQRGVQGARLVAWVDVAAARGWAGVWVSGPYPEACICSLQPMPLPMPSGKFAGHKSLGRILNSFRLGLGRPLSSSLGSFWQASP